MLRRTKVKIMHNGELVNTYSETHGSWINPFEVLPLTGDTITIQQGSHEQEQYEVKSRGFIAKAEFVGVFRFQEVILNVVKIQKICVGYLL